MDKKSINLLQFQNNIQCMPLSTIHSIVVYYWVGPDLRKTEIDHAGVTTDKSVVTNGKHPKP